MEILLMVIIILISLLLFLNIYKVNDLSYKLERVRKRYDKLLRGRGELNLEELLGQQSKDVELALTKIDEFEKISIALQSEFGEKSSGIEHRLNKEISESNRIITERMDNLEANYVSDFDILSNKVEKNINNIVSSNNKFKEDLSTNTEKLLKTVNDRLAFAVQKQILHRYNALENQSGELSFTMILLDQLNNGIMITSINGRESSYAYAKGIKNGKAEYECSPEEQEALDKLLGNK